MKCTQNQITSEISFFSNARTFISLCLFIQLKQFSRCVHFNYGLINFETNMKMFNHDSHKQFEFSNRSSSILMRNRISIALCHPSCTVKMIENVCTWFIIKIYLRNLPFTFTVRAQCALGHVFKSSSSFSICNWWNWVNFL